MELGDRLIVIGLTGVAGSGKDPVADILRLHHRFFRIALADAVRSSLRDLDGDTWTISKELGAAGLDQRWALQRIGGDAREEVAADVARCTDAITHRDAVEHQVNLFWTHLTLTKIHYLHRIHPVRRNRFVIPDISYPHEPDLIGPMVRRWGGLYCTWRIDRDGAGLQGTAAQHASELGRATLETDAILRFSGGIADLADLVAAELAATVGSADAQKSS